MAQTEPHPLPMGSEAPTPLSGYKRLPTVLLHSTWTPSRAVSIAASLELRLGKFLACIRKLPACLL